MNQYKTISFREKSQISGIQHPAIKKTIPAKLVFIADAGFGSRFSRNRIAATFAAGKCKPGYLFKKLSFSKLNKH